MVKKKRLRYARKEMEKLANRAISLGDLLRAIRMSDGETLSKLARTLKVSLQHLSDIEQGRRTVSPERASKFAKVLGAPEEVFVHLAIQDMLDKSGLGHLKIIVS